LPNDFDKYLETLKWADTAQEGKATSKKAKECCPLGETGLGNTQTRSLAYRPADWKHQVGRADYRFHSAIKTIL
jgi:hypothetical protein